MADARPDWRASLKRTATVQVNLDYGSEEDAQMKTRAIMAVTPMLTALYANSPIVDGKDSGYQSYRGHIWTKMDPDRCGLLDFVFQEGEFFRQFAVTIATATKLTGANCRRSASRQYCATWSGRTVSSAIATSGHAMP